LCLRGQIGHRHVSSVLHCWIRLYIGGKWRYISLLTHSVEEVNKLIKESDHVYIWLMFDPKHED
jgi:hypothetical protein